MPRAVIADAFGPPANYELCEIARREPKPGQVRVAIKAAGISFVDVLTAAGNYQVKPPLPFCPGSEAAGVTVQLGEGVTDFVVGDRVVCSNWCGLFADEAVLPQAALQHIPGSMDFAEAAVFPVSYATAWYALADRGAVQPGETVLVLGAGGATGYASVQVAKQLGATVIGSAWSADKRALALSAGADEVVDAGAADWREQVRAANGGKPVDVVFDPVGGDATEPAFRSLGWGGRHLIIGFPGGIAALRTNLPLLKGASLVGVDIRQFGEREPGRAKANRAKIFELAGRGVFKPAIARTYPLGDFAAAMTDAAAGKSAGRIVLTMD